jgi:hypothetical protein
VLSRADACLELPCHCRSACCASEAASRWRALALRALDLADAPPAGSALYTTGGSSYSLAYLAVGLATALWGIIVPRVRGRSADLRSTVLFAYAFITAVYHRHNTFDDPYVVLGLRSHCRLVGWAAQPLIYARIVKNSGDPLGFYKGYKEREDWLTWNLKQDGARD